MTGALRRLATGVLAPLGAALGLVVVYGVPRRLTRGRDARWAERARRRVSVLLGRVLDERAGPREITADEYAGWVDRRPGEVESLLHERGFERNPIARVKTRGGVPEVGSWVHRASPLARRQLHVMLFARSDGGTDVYAHEELSSVHPFVGAGHFEGAGQDPELGVALARARLPLELHGEPDPAT